MGKLKKTKKADISNKPLFHNTNWQSKNVIVSACITWYGAKKPFFINNKGLNAKRYKKAITAQH